MVQRDTVDFTGAVIVGALVGLGAVWLLRNRRSAADRIRRELKPHRRRLGRRARRARKELGAGAGASAAVAEELVAATRTLIAELRTELSHLVGEARVEIDRAVRQGLKEARLAGGGAVARLPGGRRTRR